MSVRFTENTNLTVYVNNDYKGLPLLPNCYPYAEEYLERCYRVMRHALSRYPAVTAIRFDLHYPSDMPLPSDAMSNHVMSCFTQKLRERIRAEQYKAHRDGKRVHWTELDYVWVREIGDSQRPHYHVMIFLNHQAFMSLGNPDFENENVTMAYRIRNAWAYALRIDYEKAKYLAHFTELSSHSIRLDNQRSIHEAFKALSYLCKHHSKQYGLPGHSIGSSQLPTE